MEDLWDSVVSPFRSVYHLFISHPEYVWGTLVVLWFLWYIGKWDQFLRWYYDKKYELEYGPSKLKDADVVEHLNRQRAVQMAQLQRSQERAQPKAPAPVIKPAYLEDLASFKKALIDAGDKLVVLDFTAVWCRPCQAIAPYFEQLANENAGTAIFYKVDVDQNPDTSQECKIASMPTFQFFKKGTMIDAFSGASQDKLREKVNQHK